MKQQYIISDAGGVDEFLCEMIGLTYKLVSGLDIVHPTSTCYVLDNCNFRGRLGGALEYHRTFAKKFTEEFNNAPAWLLRVKDDGEVGKKEFVYPRVVFNTEVLEDKNEKIRKQNSREIESNDIRLQHIYNLQQRGQSYDVNDKKRCEALSEFWKNLPV